jgi:acetylornithine aminotransferase
VCCAAALAVLATIDEEGLLDHVKQMGELIRRGVEGLGHPLVREVRGAGLLLGIGLAAPVSGVLQSALQTAGFLTNAARPDTLRLAPPLIVSTEQVEAFLAALPGSLSTASASTVDGAE